MNKEKYEANYGNQKLLKLLNEYEKTFGELREVWTFYDHGYHRGEEGYYYSELQLISRSFGFIQRLVKNDKIVFEGPSHLRLFYEPTDALLMTLARRNNPIKYLITILK